MRSLLITGGTPESRKTEAAAIAVGQSSKFDTVFVDALENKGIQSVREIITVVSHKPFESKVTTIIIHEAENLTVQAQNALLKTLEEPPNSCQIILTGSSTENLLPTIVSRCLETRLVTEIKSTEAKLNENTVVKSIGETFEELEKIGLDSQIKVWSGLLKQATTEPKKSKYSLQILHRYNKVLLRLKKAEKLLANKKLLFLLAALEMPQIERK